MIENPISNALAEAVCEVLEKMFFIDLLTPSSVDRPRPQGVAVQVRFDGDPPGTLRLDLDWDVARAAAAGFLGQDPAQLTTQQIHQVACELANMICGSVLSRIESSAVFRLVTPELAGEPEECTEPANRTSFHADLSGGALRAEIRMERPVCPELDAPAF